LIVEKRAYLFDARMNHGLTQVARSDLFTGIGDTGIDVGDAVQQTNYQQVVVEHNRGRL
jgi:hypothetical protein